ncbi:MAG TPA: DUF4136 domain-containing protein [Povalibacter sp.]|nr:DUF4136 domain-containing protein [Povalibacter sp.]
MKPQHSRLRVGPPSAALAASLMLAGCASTSPPVHSMQDPQANFNTFTTFNWDQARDATEPVSIIDTNIRLAIAGELQKKGYAEAVAGAKPDLVLQYETAAAETMKSNPIRIGIGMGGAGSNGAAGVGVSSPSAKVVRQGTLVLRVIDPARNAEVWNGRVSREIASQGVPNQALIQNAVGELLKEFPARGNAPK